MTAADTPISVLLLYRCLAGFVGASSSPQRTCDHGGSFVVMLASPRSPDRRGILPGKISVQGGACAIASATRAQRAPLTVIFVPVTGWLARGGRPVSSCWRGHQALRPAPPAAGCGETARGSRRDAGLPPGGFGDAAAPSSGGPRRREPLTAGAAPDRLPGVWRPAPGARRRPSRLARRRRALEAVEKVVTGTPAARRGVHRRADGWPECCRG